VVWVAAGFVEVRTVQFQVFYWGAIVSDFSLILFAMIPYFEQKLWLPINGDYAVERFGNIFLITLGEAIIGALAKAVNTGKKDIFDISRSAIVISISFLMQLVYFDSGEDVKKHALIRSPRRSGIWLILNIFLLIDTSLFGTLIELYVKEGHIKTLSYRVLCCSIAAFFVLSVIMQTLHKGFGVGVRRIPKIPRNVLKIIVAVLIASFGYIKMDQFYAFLILIGMLLIAVVVDLIGRQFKPITDLPDI